MPSVAVGSYAITAKTVADPTGFTETDTLTCILVVAGTTVDTAEYERNPRVITLAMMSTATLASTGSILLRCNATAAATVRFSHIIATKVDSITRDAVTG
jgi:hypothetical protein